MQADPNSTSPNKDSTVSSSAWQHLFAPFDGLAPGTENKDVLLHVHGQIVLKRVMGMFLTYTLHFVHIVKGKGLAFMELRHPIDGSVLQLRFLQTIFDENAVSQHHVSLAALCKTVKIGDTVEASGFPERFL